MLPMSMDLRREASSGLWRWQLIAGLIRHRSKPHASSKQPFTLSLFLGNNQPSRFGSDSANNVDQLRFPCTQRDPRNNFADTKSSPAEPGVCRVSRQDGIADSWKRDGRRVRQVVTSSRLLVIGPSRGHVRFAPRPPRIRGVR